MSHILQTSAPLGLWFTLRISRLEVIYGTISLHHSKAMEWAIFIFFITMPAISCQICMSGGRSTVNSCVNVGLMGPHAGVIFQARISCVTIRSHFTTLCRWYFWIWSFFLSVVESSHVNVLGLMAFDWNGPKLDVSQQRDVWKFCSETIIIGMFLCGWSQSKDSDSHGKHKTWQTRVLNL